MAEAGMLYRQRAIDEIMGKYGYEARLLGRSIYFCEPMRTAATQWCLAVAQSGSMPIRTFDAGECVWDVLANRISVSQEHMMAQMFAADRARQADAAYAEQQAGAEMIEAARHMDGKIHIAI